MPSVTYYVALALARSEGGCGGRRRSLHPGRFGKLRRDDRGLHHYGPHPVDTAHTLSARGRPAHHLRLPHSLPATALRQGAETLVIHHAKSGNFYIISIDIGTSSAKALSRSTAS